MKLGATGKFPGGKLNPDDQGELQLAIGLNVKTGLVEMWFGKQVSWLAMTRQDAIQMAHSLIDAAGGTN
jgi:hypothetical protein